MHTLLTPLDWGLGHASRSLALARRLEAEGQRVSWASSGPAAEMLRRELPGQVVHDLPPYRVTYPSRNMRWNVALQAWRWQRTVREERKVTARLVDELGVDRIISDSRFGCFHPEVPSIFLTHQLHPITHFAPATAVYRWQLGHFDEFWIPDDPDHGRLSGKLSDPSGYDKVSFIGPLPRLSPHPGTAPFDVLAVLSGPEPMRSRLEAILLPQLAALPWSVKVVRGLPAGATPPAGEYPFEIINFADTAQLSALVTAARFVVSRSGYSTLMDLRALEKKAVLIPTPGQTEQEYLARRAQLQGWAVAAMEQDELDLRRSLERLSGRVIH